MQNRILLAACLALVALILFVPGYSSLAQSPESMENLVETICKAVQESTADVYSGRGVARVHYYQDFPVTKPRHVSDAPLEPGKPEWIGREELEEEYLIEFIFKGQSTRADKYTLEEGKRGEFLSSDVDTLKQSFSYIKGSPRDTLPQGFSYYYKTDAGEVWIRPPHEDRRFYRTMGKDFHPEVLNRIGRGPFDWEMRGFRTAKKITTTYTEDGLLCIEGEGLGEGSLLPSDRYFARTLILDPAADYRPVEYTRVGEVGEYASMSSAHYQAKWKKYGSAWYIERLKYSEEWKSKEEFKEIDPDFKWWVEIEIESLDPTVEVKDSEFTLEGLNIPIGALVTDRIAGVIYYYKTPPVGEKDLEEIFKTSDLYAEKVAPETGQIKEEAAAEITPAVIEPEQKDRSARSPTLKIIMFIVIAAIFAGIVGLLLNRFRATRKVHNE